MNLCQIWHYHSSCINFDINALAHFHNSHFAACLHALHSTWYYPVVSVISYPVLRTWHACSITDVQGTCRCPHVLQSGRNSAWVDCIPCCVWKNIEMFSLYYLTYLYNTPNELVLCNFILILGFHYLIFMPRASFISGRKNKERNA